MENVNNFNAEDLQKCPYHSQQLNTQNNDDPRENANTGDWDDIDDDDTAKNPDYDGQGENDNSGGAGSSGSAATNSRFFIVFKS